MKVLSLQCNALHQFEGWFADEDDFQKQLTHGLLTCPVCGHHTIVKLPSAPHLNLRATQVNRHVVDDNTLPLKPSSNPEMIQAAVWQALRRLVQQADNVGAHFTEQALAMHRGETESRAIRGQATPEQTEQLLDEGVDILPLPSGLDDPLH